MNIQEEYETIMKANQKKKTSKKIIGHIITHTHWDREWRVPVWNSHWRLLQMMEKLLDKLEKNAEFKFLFDGQVVGIEDYLEVCPDKRPQVEKFIKEGRLQIGPWYNLPDLYPVSGEALIRNLLIGNRKANKFGKCLDIAYTAFGWGQTAQFPQILKGFGMERVVCAKNVSKKRAPNSEFWWQGSDGTRLLTTRLGVEKRANFFFFAVMPAIYGHKYTDYETRIKWGQNGWLWHPADSNIDAEITFIPDETYHPEIIEEAIKETLETTKDTLISEHLFLGSGCDSTAPSDVVDKIIADTNRLFGGLELKYSDLETYFKEIEKVIDKKQIQLNTVCGELRDGPVHSLSANALATRMPLKTLNRKAQDNLIRYGEAFAALAKMIGISYPQTFIDKAWHYLLLAHSHDAINGVTLDKTAEDTAYKLKQVIELSQVVMDMAATEILKKVDLSRYDQDDILLAVFNPSPRPKQQTIHITVDISTEKSCRRLAVTDSDGKKFAVQAVSHFSHQAPVCVQNSRALPFYADRHTMYLDVGQVPAYGYKILKLSPEENYNKNTMFWLGTYEHKGQVTGPNQMANSYMEVEINPDGTFDLTSKVTGHKFKGLGFYEDRGDVGDYWQRVKPNFDRIYNSKNSDVEIYLKEDGLLVTTYVCEITLKIPVKAEKDNRFASSRVDEKVDLRIAMELTLKAKKPYLEVKTTIFNTAKDHRLRVAFPTFIKTDISDAMGHFNVDSRPIPRDYDENDMRDGEMGTLPMQNFLDLSDGQTGLTFLNKNLIEFEVSEDRTKTVYLTLLRCMDVNIATENRCGIIETGAHGSQCLGEHTFEYALYPHKGNWKVADVYEKMEEYVYSPRAYQISGHNRGFLPEQMSLFAVNNKMIQVSGIKKTQDEEGVIIRLYNPTDETINCSISLACSVKEAWLTNMNEEKQEKLKFNKTNVILKFKPCKIITLLLKGFNGHAKTA